MIKCVAFAIALAGTALGAPPFARAVLPGEIGAYFDPEGTVTGGLSGGPPLPNSGVLQAFVPFDIYVVSKEVPAGQEAYEFSLDIDARVTALEETVFPGGASDSGVDDGNFKNYLVATGGECYGNGTSEILVQWNCLLFAAADDVFFCVGPASPSSFSPPRAGYLACDSPGDLRLYLLGPCGGTATTTWCAVGNSVTVPPISTQSSTWGAIKTRF